FMQAARVILLRPANWPKHGFGAWLARAAQRLHPNVLAVALANKLARIAWTVLAQERAYESRITKAAACNEDAQDQGGGCRPTFPRALAGLGDRATVASKGRLKLPPRALIGFPTEVCELE